MKRRQFLITLTTSLGALPLLITQIACERPNGDPYSSEDDTGDDTTGRTGSFTVESSPGGAHRHTVTIEYRDVDDSPSGGRTLSTSSSGGAYGHFHGLTLTRSDFQALKDGQVLTKTTSTDSGHSHAFTIEVPASS